MHYVSLIQPYEHSGNDMPLRMYGVLPIMVADPKTMLHPEVSVPDVLQPDKEFSVTVSEKDKQPMAYTISVVDEGLLGLRDLSHLIHGSFFIGRKLWLCRHGICLTR